jgi:peptide deformylase
MVKIVQQNNLVLREKAKSVLKKDIKTPSISKILNDMKKALELEEFGVAIAAPQIGVSLRIFIISGKVLGKTLGEKAPDRVFINPEIIKISKKKEWMEEGCLSVRWKYGEVHRATKATVRALDEHGKPFTLGASGLIAQIFQHEIDHLEGTLFIDTARDIRTIPAPNNVVG